MKCVSLYTGCGGMDLGFHDAGYNIDWANELSATALESYKGELTRRGKALPTLINGDISKAILPARGSADVVIGGPPCQGFSVAGKMNANDPRSKHVWEFFRVVEHIQPIAFVMENVKALGKNRRWKDTRIALQKKAEQLGYQTRLLLLNSADYGVPQQRERMFLVGIKGRTMAIPPIHKKRTSVREALSTLPSYNTIGNNSLCKAIITPAKSPVLRKSPFAGMLFNGQGRPIDLDSPSPTLPASMGGNRTPIIDQNNLTNGSQHWVVNYHAHLLNGGGIASSIPSHLRRLTVEEAAHIQGFPIGMEFAGSQCAKFTQIGNAVPPPLAKAVASTLKKIIESESILVEMQDDQSCILAEPIASYITN